MDSRHKYQFYLWSNDKGRGHKKFNTQAIKAKDHQRWNDTSLDPNRDQSPDQQEDKDRNDRRRDTFRDPIMNFLPSCFEGNLCTNAVDFCAIYVTRGI